MYQYTFNFPPKSFSTNHAWQHIKGHKIYKKFSISKSKDAQNMAFFMKITFLVLSLILAFTRKEFILIGDLAFGGRTPVMVLVLIEIADAFIDRKNNSMQVERKKRSSASMEMQRRK